MHRRMRYGLALGALVALVAAGMPAQAGHKDDPRTKNVHPMGHIVEPRSLFHGDPNVHTDIAFWGKHAFQGTWLGFNVRDISAPGNPKQVSFTSCEGNQGDVVVWDDVLVRSWNSEAGEGQTCDGQPVPPGFEGLHVFDISNLANPELVGAVPTECGSHTASGVPDLANNRLLIYNSPSSTDCPGIDIVQVPLDMPETASYLSFVPAGRSCHDTGIILGDAMKAACAGGDGFTLFDISGSLTAPVPIRSQTVPGVTIGHSASFSWDGEVLIFGHEPGGGVAPECEESDPPSDYSAFFFSVDSGALLSMWTIPRPQSSTENCTVHNYNAVPLRKGDDVLVLGNYQAGTWVVDFNDPTDPKTLGWSDPPPIVPADLGGAWSTYWYNGFMYETNITEGLNVFRYSGRETRAPMKLGHLNPQTQEFTIP